MSFNLSDAAGRGGHMLNTNCVYNENTKEKPVPFPRDRPQQQTALAGVIAAAHWGFMKQYFFLITAHTGRALSKSLGTVDSLTLRAPLGDTGPRAIDPPKKSIISEMKSCHHGTLDTQRDFLPAQFSCTLWR